MTEILSPTYVPEVRVTPPPWQQEAGGGLRITRISCTITAPDGVNLVIVKVETNQDGLVGYGCATFTQRAFAVRTVIEDYIAPFLIGRDPGDITDIAASLTLDSYWRSGPVTNNAVSGIDMALWDIKGKVAGMPVWQLLGGRARESVTTYVHATGATVDELSEQIERHLEVGYTHIRCQVSVPGSLTYGAIGSDSALTWNPRDYLRYIPGVFAELRQRFGQTEFIHDVHERLHPHDAVSLVRRLDEFGLFFVEDALAPEDLGWLPRLRERTSSPLAIGELFSKVDEYLPLIQNRLIDFIRCHVSAIGGITPAWRLAGAAELFGVRTAWHGPRDVSPVGHAANIALDLASPAFGIHEHFEFSEQTHAVFPGTAVAERGQLRPNGKPGLGIDFDEKQAALHPPTDALANWHYGRVRRPDGALQRP
ncbi:enolase C-terminal domain-like protein [Microbacterium sp. A196]|uniref:enolase C-terminal domain-like protein n=1 Tax=Microbacterium sp. A196 TaxID=3457320 RepID=UPI003FD656BC